MSHAEPPFSNGETRRALSVRSADPVTTDAPPHASRAAANERRLEGTADASAREEIPWPVVTERILLSALREQDAAAAAEHARARAQFLAEAGLRLGASLDQELTYAAIADLGLPGLDAWCIVDIVEAEGGLRRLAVVHPDESKQVVARSLLGRWAPAADDPIGVPAIRLHRRSVVIGEGADDVVAAAAGDPETVRVLRWLGAGALLVVPIVAHDVLLGAITYVGRPGAADYTPSEVALGAALADRAGQALEAARLYATARVALAAADAARAKAETANATKAHFLSTMSHELRTPLNAIGGYAQLMALGLRGPVTAEQQRDLTSIQRAQTHLLGLVEAVLDYAQLDAGRVTYALSDLPLVEVVAGAHALVAPQMQAKGVAYRFEPPDGPLTARADESKVRQIVLNLLGNASKFTPAGGHVTVTFASLAQDATSARAAGAGSMIAVRVADDGVGIAADQLATVFDPFVQVDRGLTSPTVGVGLGLAISRELARGMGGDLTGESVLGVGSTFTLMLPGA